MPPKIKTNGALKGKALRSMLIETEANPVTIDGLKFRILNLSFSDRREFISSMPDVPESPTSEQTAAYNEANIKGTMRVMISLVQDEDGAQVFSEDDLDTLYGNHVHGVVGKLMREVKLQLEGGSGELSKESGETESSSSPA